MTSKDLEVFCVPGRNKLDKPWSAGEYSYASDGTILLRVPRIQEILALTDVVDVKSLDAAFVVEPKGWFKAPKMVKEMKPCDRCDGSGKDYTCPECWGSGEVSWKSDYGNDYEDSCKTCSGSGTLPKEDFDKLDEKEKNAQKCYRCDGAGVLEKDEGVEIGGKFGVLISSHRLCMLSTLEDVEIGVVGDETPNRLRFKGGDGLIMPMRR